MKPFEDAVDSNRRIVIETQARADADAADLRYPFENSKPPSELDASAVYWAKVVRAGERIVYVTAYQKRIWRRERLEQWGFVL